MSNKSHVEFNFQRGTDIAKLELELGRSATADEIERAKKTPYAVDYVFCDRCEKIFTQIETIFVQQILPQLRESNLTGKATLEFLEIRTIRLFWHLQIWRSAVCDRRLSVSDKVQEELRIQILNYESVSIERLVRFPLLVTYLETLGGQETFTQNFVGFINTKNPFVIFMNDFVIQFNENTTLFYQANLPGFNPEDYENYINYGEQRFVIRILSDTARRNFLERYRLADAKGRLAQYAVSLSRLWRELFHTNISDELLQSFIDQLTSNSEESILNYSQENIKKVTVEFIKRHAPG